MAAIEIAVALLLAFGPRFLTAVVGGCTIRAQVAELPRASRSGGH
jgi:hypothetical protein